MGNPPIPTMGSDNTVGPGGRRVQMGGNQGGNQMGANLGLSGSRGAAESQSALALSPEAQIIMMEAQRAKWIEERNPAASIIPPTP